MERRTPKRSMIFSLLGVAVGLVALGLTIIPAIAFERMPPNPIADAMKEKEKDRAAELEGGVNLKIKNVVINFGGKEVKKKKPENLEVTKDPFRWLMISGVGCALVGMALSTVGHVREKHAGITAISMGCCLLAIAWQYIIIGIAVGVAVAVLFFLLWHLS